MNLTVIGMTTETDGISQAQMEDLKTYCGKNAGISQLREGFFGTAVSDPEKALPRFRNTVRMGHMSIADHAWVEVLFENASRMMAMIMNSLQYYNTTEKSGRYTEMTGNTPEQRALYDKWNEKFRKRIMEIHPDYNDAFITKQLEKEDISGFYVKNGRIFAENTGVFSGKDTDITDRPEVREKLNNILSNPRLPVNTRSQENARYILSIFTKSTTFGYTTTLAQWNYIYDWCERYLEQFEYGNSGKLLRNIKDDTYDGTLRTATFFEEQVYKDLADLRVYLRENLYVEDLRDHKKRGFDMLTDIFDENHFMKDYDHDCDENIRFAYTTDYETSLIVLSHLHRHKTLKYYMNLDVKHAGFYVPVFIKDTPDEKEWLDDMESVREQIPAGMLVHVIETGTLDNFALKTSERFCGCAMLETMLNVKSVAEKFVKLYESGRATWLEKNVIEKFYDPKCEKLRTKATITDGCHEGCYFGCKHALDRIV